MTIAILNASNPGSTLPLEADSYVDYRQGRATCFEGARRLKQCSSWHSWPYAMETEFFVFNKPGWEGVYKYNNIVVLVNRDIDLVFPLVRKLKLMKKKVAISFHEGVQDLITGSGAGEENLAKRWTFLYQLVQEADFYINIFGQMSSFLRGWLGQDKVKYCSHGAPLDWDHGFTKPKNERPFDILVGTRTFNQRLSRNTLVTLGIVNNFAKNGKSVHFLSEDGDVGPMLKNIGFNNINFHQGPLNWVDWLKFLSNFKMLVHHDTSSNLGQVCYDCEMVDVYAIGSTTWNNKLMQNDDGGDTRRTEYMINKILSGDGHNEGMRHFFRVEIYPDKVKQNLLEIFK